MKTENIFVIVIVAILLYLLFRKKTATTKKSFPGVRSLAPFKSQPVKDVVENENPELWLPAPEANEEIILE